MDRREFLSGAAALAALPVASVTAQTPPRPIVFIIADELFSVVNYRTKFGVPISTPNFNQLMRRGVSFMNAFCATALCNPSRTSIFTGKNPFKTGVHYNYDPWQNFVPPGDMLFAMLKNAGWHTYSFGKTLHSVDLNATPLAPYLDQAYSHQWSVNADTADPYNIPKAIERMKSLPPGPYFMALGITDPHEPFIAAQRFVNLYPLSKIKVPDWKGDRPPNWVLPWLNRAQLNKMIKNRSLDDYVQHYLANISEMDFSLGRLIANIDKWGRNPIIIFTSDHGFTLGDHDHIGKFTLWDEAGRAPLIVVDPDLPSNRRNIRITDTVSQLDIAPTILDYAGLPIPSDMDGQSLRLMMYDPIVRRNLGTLTTMMGSASLRTNGLRYTRYQDGSEEFFNMLKDPEATNNLIQESKTTPYLAKWLRDMRTLFNKKRAAWMGTSPKCDVTFPSGIIRKIC